MHMEYRGKYGSGFSMVEVMLGAVILVILLVPVITVMQSSTRSSALSRDHLVAEHLARSIYEYVAFWGSTDPNESFEEAESIFEVADTLTCPINGLKGKSVTELSTQTGDILMPDDGQPRYDLGGNSGDYANLFKKFSYSLDITKSTQDSVVATDSKATLFRIDIKVYWKDANGQNKEVQFSNYLAKRKY